MSERSVQDADQELRMLKRQMLAMMQTMQAELTETRLMLGALADRAERMRHNVEILAMGIQTDSRELHKREVYGCSGYVLLDDMDTKQTGG